jgi:uncharacterized protein YyaL (SSP411 family)
MDETWRPWGEAAFTAAARRGTPVCLFLTAPWCGRCRETARAFETPTVRSALDDLVAVRVDADRRPRVRARYAAGRLPTVAFLDPDGGVLSAATALDADTLAEVCGRVRESFEDDQVGREPAGGDLPAGEVTDRVEAAMARRVERRYDDRHGGFGSAPKFPHARATEFALARDREHALGTLNAVGTGLADRADGGFYRCALARDWTDVRHEKLLDVNAVLLRAFAHAYLLTGSATYLDPAERTRDYLVETLWTGTAFAGSQEPGDYFEHPPAERADADPPPVDDTAFADRNAIAADALLALFAYTDDAAARRYAEGVLDFLDRLRDGGRLPHYPGAPDDAAGLSDAAAALGAYVRAAQVLDRGLGAARAVADDAERLRDEAGAFRDGTGGAGALSQPLYPIDGNAAMANALVDLAALTGDERYRRRARDAVAAFAGAADRVGLEAAEYATAAARVRRSPLVVRVAAEAGGDLHRAALRMADHEKVVVPDADGQRGTARVDGVESVARSPAELEELVSAPS